MVARGLASDSGKGGGEVGGKEDGKGGGGGGGKGGGIGPSSYLALCLPPWLSPPRGWRGGPPRHVVADVIVVVDADSSCNRQMSS
jgi:hypothetical protein